MQKAAAYFLSNSAPATLKNEAASILSKKVLTPEGKKRLFELFIQRDDMHVFMADFKNLLALFGDVDESDPFNWTQFDITSDRDIERLQSAMKARVEELDKDPTKVKKGGKVSKYLKKLEAPVEPEEIESTDDDKFMSSELFKTDDARDDLDDEDKQKDIDVEKTFDMDNLVDSDGRPWSGIILDNDTTQKVMPGNRIMTYRVLVMIGNLRGAGGFGMGKGSTPDKATAAAFRSVFRNIYHRNFDAKSM